MRCRTSIFATVITQIDGQWYTKNDWAFNNLTYLPSPEDKWAGNNLGRTADWVAEDGRRWRTECNNEKTGAGACRNYIVAKVPTLKDGKVAEGTQWVFNSMVKFVRGTTPWVTTVPASVAKPAGVPTPSAPTPIITQPTRQNGMKLDSRCMTGRAFCVSKSQRKMAWVVNGKVDTVLDVRFGSELTPTRNGAGR